jgi:hypothetical protein
VIGPTERRTRSHPGYLFAYDKASGQIVATINPLLDGTVNALAVSPDGTKLIVGGAFVNVNGVSRKNLVALNPSTGATITTWAAHSDGGNFPDSALRAERLGGLTTSLIACRPAH